LNHLFFERADELKNMQRKLWEIITNNEEEKPDIAIRLIAELHKLSNSLCHMSISNNDSSGEGEGRGGSGSAGTTGNKRKQKYLLRITFIHLVNNLFLPILLGIPYKSNIAIRF
jgi:hypothetical protein